MIEQIKKALAEATLGPWKVDVWEKTNEVGIEVGIGDYVAVMGRKNENKHADAHLIANAPEWLRYLIGEVERWQDEALTQAKLYTQKNILCHELRERVIELQSEYRENEDRPRFKMDAQGNLTLIEEE